MKHIRWKTKNRGKFIFAGYENFVSKINTGDSEDRPDWMGHVSFSDLKLKVIGSIVAISGIELLKAFVNVEAYTNQQLGWKVWPSSSRA